jgi:hypothetical protein
MIYLTQIITKIHSMYVDDDVYANYTPIQRYFIHLQLENRPKIITLSLYYEIRWA